MALATRCPHCGTTFRVAHDQLKLRGGLVRCGSCKEIFNGTEQLLPATAVPDTDISPASAIPVEPPSQPAEIPIAPAAILAGSEIEPEFESEPNNALITRAPETAETGYHDSPESEASEDITSMRSEPFFEPVVPIDDPLQRMTLMDFSNVETYDPQQHDQEPSFDLPSDSEVVAADDKSSTLDVTLDPLDQVIDELQQKPLRGYGANADAADTPNFILDARQNQGRRWVNAGLAGASFCLLLGLLAQGAFAFRSEIAAWMPQTKSLLSSVCAFIGCRINLPMQIDQITIESNELLALTPDKNTFALTVLLRNRSNTIEAWPQIELTLNDTGETPVLRRVFGPHDYLPGNHHVLDGFAGNTEASIRIYFTLNKPKAAGYRIDLFYP